MSTLSDSSSKYILFSYHKNHQELVLKIYHHLKNENLPVWINIQDGSNKNIYQRYLTHSEKNISYKILLLFSMDEMVEKISAFVCFMTPMYQASKQYQQEIQFAKNEGIPVIGCRLLPNWKPSGWLSEFLSFRN
jgi:hypothetical protein